MTVAPAPEPGVMFEDLVEALSRLPWSRLSFALVRIELALRLGHEPPPRDIWAEYARQYPDAVRGARAMIALGLIASSNAKPTEKSPDCEASLEEMELVPRWWHRLERIRLSLAG